MRNLKILRSLLPLVQSPGKQPPSAEKCFSVKYLFRCYPKLFLEMCCLLIKICPHRIGDYRRNVCVIISVELSSLLSDLNRYLNISPDLDKTSEIRSFGLLRRGRW
jgi:hypothetical protein